MEFIPLEPINSKIKEKVKSSKKDQSALPLKSKHSPQSNDDNKTKSKGKLRKNTGKNVKNQYKERLLEKLAKKTLTRKNKKSRKNNLNQIKKGTKEGKEHLIDDDKCSDDADDGNNETEQEEIDSDNDENETTETEEKIKEQAKLEKWRQMDEKKKNRLFVKMKKKIHSESQIKEFHPDIKKVIFPRKKNSRWCWAVFVSEESAHKAFLELVKNKDLFVGKPNTREQVEIKRMKKMNLMKRKKEIAQKHLKMWI